MKNDEIVLRICDDKSIRLEIRENNKTRTKIISVDTLIECIKESIKGVKFSTGLLSKNTLCVTVNPDSAQQYVVMEFSDFSANVTYMNTKYENFPLPRLLFGFNVETSGRISSVKLGVPALGKLTPDTEMYYYPFSNVSTFSLCIGQNPLPHIKSLDQLTNLPYYILSFPDNDDYYKESHNRLGLGHRDLMEHLRDKDRQYYYDNILVPMPDKKLKDFLNGGTL